MTIRARAPVPSPFLGVALSTLGGTKSDELRELYLANLMFIALADQWAEMEIWDQAWKFIKMWPNILKQMHGLRQPTIFSLSGGQVPKLEKLYLTRELPHK